MFMAEEVLRNTLRKNRLYRTTERIYIFRLLKDQQSPCTFSELVNLSAEVADRSTVYRTLQVYEEIGVVSRGRRGNDSTFELSDMFSAHHHHMTCTNCGDVISFEESDSFVRELHKLEHQHGFKSASHSLELKGLCKSCH